MKRSKTKTTSLRGAYRNVWKRRSFPFKRKGRRGAASCPIGGLVSVSGLKAMEAVGMYGNHLFRATLSAPSRKTGWRLAPSVQSSSLLTVRLHRLYFYVVPRKLIPKLQAFSKSIQETPMVRFYSSIDSDDKMLIRQMSCDSVLHGISPPNRYRASS
jgi:hypothetical protein